SERFLAGATWEVAHPPCLTLSATEADEEYFQIGGYVQGAFAAAFVVQVALQKQLHPTFDRFSVPAAAHAEEIARLPGHGDDAAVRWKLLLNVVRQIPYLSGLESKCG